MSLEKLFLHPNSGKPVEALLFDLDGTLVDSAPDISTAINAILKAQGHEVLDVPVVRSLIGEGIKRLTQKAFAVRGRAISGDELDSLTAEFAVKYAACIADQTRPLPGVVECLHALKAAGYKLAVVSNKAQALTERLLALIGLTPLFDHIQGAQTALAPKPAPDMLFATLLRLGTTSATSIFIGDSGIDVAAGNAAGLPVVLVEGGYATSGNPHEGASHVFHDFHAFLQWTESRDA